MKYSLRLFYLFVAFKFAKSNQEGYITGGAFTKYNFYPHAVFLNIVCEQYFMCGGSILNQDLILTAAHCMQGCEVLSKTNVEVYYGHETLSQMKTTFMKRYMQHRDYNDQFMMNDICLILVQKSIRLNDIVKRIILMKYPPFAKYAYVAGWGLDENEESQQSLKHAAVVIQNGHVCEHMGWLPDGVFCAGPVSGLGSAELGDSGGALVIHDFIQIGIVSFNVDKYSLVAYTNTSYHLEWIRRNARKLVC